MKLIVVQIMSGPKIYLITDQIPYLSIGWHLIGDHTLFQAFHIDKSKVYFAVLPEKKY